MDLCKAVEAQGSEWSTANASMQWMLLKRLRSFTYGCGPYSISGIWVNSKGKASFVCYQQQVSVPATQQQQQVMQRPDTYSHAFQVTQAVCYVNTTDGELCCHMIASSYLLWPCLMQLGIESWSLLLCANSETLAACTSARAKSTNSTNSGMQNCCRGWCQRQ